MTMKYNKEIAHTNRNKMMRTSFKIKPKTISLISFNSSKDTNPLKLNMMEEIFKGMKNIRRSNLQLKM